MKISVDNLANAIASELETYKQEVADITKNIAREVSEDGVKELKEKSPVDSGKYKRGWKAKVMYENRAVIRVRIYNTRGQLTHLLEHGHAKTGGGRVDGIPHIAPVEQKIIKQYEQRVKAAIENESS